MRALDRYKLQGLADDLEIELSKLAKLERQVQQTQRNIKTAPEYAETFYESLAFKFHSFYTGCERIFSLIAVEMNGGVPEGADWHRRLLDRMTIARGDRIVVIQPETAVPVRKFLAFRHVVRNIYGFELDAERLENLLSVYPEAWSRLEKDVRGFVDWLNSLAIALEKD